MENYSSESRYVYFNSRDSLVRIDLTKVVYFEADGNYTSIVSLIPESKVIILANIGKIERLLALSAKDHSAVFVRIGKKYIINSKYIFSITPLRQELVLSDQSGFHYTLEASKEALKALKETMMSKLRTKQ